MVTCHLRARLHSGPLGYCFGITLHLGIFLLDGNERRTVNLVPARTTRTAGAPPSFVSNFRDFANFQNFHQKSELFETTEPDRTFPWNYHFAILLSPIKS